ncbi:synaptonemal complex central element protein 3 isoform X2 [Centrocercus urophasianus]|uniref:synaptonemal complex central element protein 3 isoform X2 n=1 Tax=Centrocercus urophasianus TaxID=9002 RepID=UPI001C64DF9C|nr:synaptonemal complex central element protein 3 isoform X2 [Centrocercus urophasianus]
MKLDVHLKCFKCFKSTVTRGISSTFICNKNLEMARQEPQERNYDNMLKMIEDLNRDLEKLLEEMEKLTVQATWMAYDMVVMRTNPDLTDSMRRLEEAFLNCREEMEKKWQEVLRESKGEEQKKE